MGAQIVDVSLPHTEYGIAAYYVIALCEASSNLARYDGVHYGHRTKEPVKDIIELFSKSRAEGFGEEVQRRIMMGTYALSGGYASKYYVQALKMRTLIKRDFDQAFEKCDVILTPTSPTPAFKIGEKTADPLAMYLCDVFTVTCNIAGIAGMSLPCGFTDGANRMASRCRSACSCWGRCSARRRCFGRRGCMRRRRSGICAGRRFRLKRVEPRSHEATKRFSSPRDDLREQVVS